MKPATIAALIVAIAIVAAYVSAPGARESAPKPPADIDTTFDGVRY